MGERPALPQPGDVVADKYRVECAIGSGGMSVVFGATHVVTGKRFAIKWLLVARNEDASEATQRFIREAQVAGRFMHPNIVEVYDVGEADGAYFMVMEWLEGESLAAKLDRECSFSFRTACDLLIPCMLAIDDAHNAGVVHRDLKPANIFVCEATRHSLARPKVLDFGISKWIELPHGEISPVVTRTGTLVGTPYYLAPEQLRSLPADRRTDIYAFGVILYQVLSGEMPFPSTNFAELVLQIATSSPTPLRQLVPSLPAGVEYVVERAMARDPAQRYPDMRALVADLEALQLHHSGLNTGPRSPPPPLPLALATTNSVATMFRTPTPFASVVPVRPDATPVMQRPTAAERLPAWAVWVAVLVLLGLTAGLYKRWTTTPGLAKGEHEAGHLQPAAADQSTTSYEAATAHNGPAVMPDAVTAAASGPAPGAASTTLSAAVPAGSSPQVAAGPAMKQGQSSAGSSASRGSHAPTPQPSAAAHKKPRAVAQAPASEDEAPPEPVHAEPPARKPADDRNPLLRMELQ
jgi:serine/threonine protein kinase